MKKWAPLKGYEEYYKISTEGEVLNLSTNNILSVNLHSSGYHRLKLNIKGKRITKYLYHLLGTAFVENFNSELYDKLSFKDGDKSNYFPDNLYWTNTKEINSKSCVEVKPGTVINNFTVQGEGEPYIWKGKTSRRTICSCQCGEIRNFSTTDVNLKKIPDNCGCIPNEIIPLDINAANKKLENEYRYITKEISAERTKNGKIKRIVETECRKCNKKQKVRYRNFIENNSGCWDCMFKEGIVGSDGENIKTHGLSKHPLYNRYNGIKQRCYYPKAKGYSYYGGRGIKMCDEWLNDFQSFYDWAVSNGYEEHLEIDRKNANLGYTPNNCRWITPKENYMNQRGMKLSYDKAKEIRKSSLSREELCKKYNVSIGTIESVINNRTWVE